MWTILKVFIALIRYCFCCFCDLVLAIELGIFAPLSGNESAPPALEGEALTTRPQEVPQRASDTIHFRTPNLMSLIKSFAPCLESAVSVGESGPKSRAHFSGFARSWLHSVSLP